MRRTVAEGSSEHKRIAEHFVRTGATPSRARHGRHLLAALAPRLHDAAIGGTHAEQECCVQKALAVLRMERLALPRLERQYRTRLREIRAARGSICTELPACHAPRAQEEALEGLNEVLLYHGCKASSIDPILMEGFDIGRGGERSGNFFGRGTYFTDIAAKADTYTDATCDGKRCVIVAQACLGEVFIARAPIPNLERPPAKASAGGDGEAVGTFDSVLGEDTLHGGVLDHREYVIYCSAQALPRYLIWYSHTKHCNCFRCGVASVASLQSQSIPGPLLPPLVLPGPAYNDGIVARSSIEEGEGQNQKLEATPQAVSVPTPMLAGSSGLTAANGTSDSIEADASTTDGSTAALRSGSRFQVLRALSLGPASARDGDTGPGLLTRPAGGGNSAGGRLQNTRPRQRIPVFVPPRLPCRTLSALPPRDVTASAADPPPGAKGEPAKPAVSRSPCGQAFPREMSGGAVSARN